MPPDYRDVWAHLALRLHWSPDALYGLTGSELRKWYEHLQKAVRRTG